MNNILVIMTLGLVLASCNFISDPVRKSAEAYLMENLNDPSSYEFVSLVPTDTITYLDNIEAQIKVYQEVVSSYMMLAQLRRDDIKRLNRITNRDSYVTNDLIDADISIQDYLKRASDNSLIITGIDSIRKALGDRVNEVACYEFEFTYRAKNAMGGLILTRATLQITPEYNVLAIASTPEDKIETPNDFPGYSELVLTKYYDQ